MRVLVIGGTGFVGRAVVKRLVRLGASVTIVGRARRPQLGGVTFLSVDRRQPGALEAAVRGVANTWDAIIDCAAFYSEDVVQDVNLFRARAGHLVLISSDAVFDPESGRFPRNDTTGYQSTGYGADKRKCEIALEGLDAGDMRWTILRPTHVYGPGSQIGCLPWHLRDPDLLKIMLDGRPIKLVAGGCILQQPIFVDDLAELAISCVSADRAHKGRYLAVGPDIVEAREYYNIVAGILGVRISIQEASLAGYADEFPEMRFVLAHRAYCSVERNLLDAGLAVPKTPLTVGLERHVRYLQQEVR